MTHRPVLLACLGARDAAGAVADARALPAAVQLLEVRLDRFGPAASSLDLARLVADLGRPAVFTLRPRSEGGESDATPTQRATRHRAADAAGFAWLDVEQDIAASIPRGRARRIVSWHGADESECTGTNASSIVARLAALDADVVKIAAPAPDADAALAFVEAAQAAGHAARVPVVAIAMGPYGRWLRPLAGRFEMPFVYAAVHGSKKTAAGQLTVAEFLDVHRAAHVSPTTRIHAVIGADVSQSLSPTVHNAVFRAFDEDAVYVDLSTPTFAQAWAVLTRLPMDGVSVTAPFKCDALQAAASASQNASAIGAANTLRQHGGTWHASNTDAPGFGAALDVALRHPERALALTLGKSFDALDALDANAPTAHGQPGSALVYGAGGVARAIAWELRRRGTRVHLTGRSFERVAATVIGLGAGIEGISPERAFSVAWPLVVNAVGDADETIPFDQNEVVRKGLAMEVAIRPLETPFLREARRWGRTPVPGLMMFAEQAALQAALFTQHDVAAVRPHVVAALRANGKR
ncbi:MAG: type I 3-dehydroquinate dehydratase [Planctomycetes bacterium]|nr:type I 3-dehydroquinate dehydratase [Planctomycetota bacterium]MCC7173030.1 type I 3-dehydroquinate dehydratase [Planctomycetota bacterium]